MAKPTRDERERRLSVVEATISERGWSLRVERDLAKAIGVTARTIRTYRSEVIDGYRVEFDEAEFDAQRAEFLGRLRGHQRVALTGDRLGPLASMLSLEARLLGLDRVDAEVGQSSVEVVLRVPGYAPTEQ